MGFPQKWQKFFSGSKKPMLFLLYHHIATPETDPWEMSVSPEHFREQLEILAKEYLVRPLSALPDVSSLPSAKPVVFISFDDGYLDNYETAVPLLENYQLPAVFFIPTRIFRRDSLFWWEVLEKVLLHTPAPRGSLQLQIGDTLKTWEITGPATAGKNSQFSAWKGEAATAAQKIYLELGELLKASLPVVQDSVSDQLINWAGNFSADASLEKINTTQLKIISGESLFEIGGHTVSHAALGNLDASAQAREIREGKAVLEKLTGTRIKSFAYPHGNYTPETKRIVGESGFEFACTTENAGIVSRTPPLQLPRIWVRDWEGETFKNILKSFIG